MSNVRKKGVSCIFISLFVLSFLITAEFEINQKNEEKILLKEENQGYFPRFSMTQIDNIQIIDDGDFAKYSSEGDGSESTPYIIENYKIVNDSIMGIFVAGTSQHFIIRNCEVYTNTHYAIYIGGTVADNICIIENNYFHSNKTIGIAVLGADFVTITNNICNDSNIGLYLDANNCTVADNTFNGHIGIAGYSIIGYGIHIVGSSSLSRGHIINNNTCNENDYGIHIGSLDYGLISNNTCNNNNVDGIFLENSNSLENTLFNNICKDNTEHGIHVEAARYNVITNNTCIGNDYGIYLEQELSSSVPAIVKFNNVTQNNYGIFLFHFVGASITYNLLLLNTHYGVYLGYAATNNLVHRNAFLNNSVSHSSQGYDEAAINLWYDAANKEGNHWTEWSGFGSYSIDGASNSEDLYPYGLDNDNDGMADNWELFYGLNITINDAALDEDSDGLNNLGEFYHKTDPTDFDTDNDLMPDGFEVDYDLDPLINDSHIDYDSDGLNNLEEYQENTKPRTWDSDEDGLNDGLEVKTYFTNPNSNDTDSDNMDDYWEVLYDLNATEYNPDEDYDNDTLSNILEYNLGTKPNNVDSDGDSLPDKYEYENNLDPAVPDAGEDPDDDGLTNYQEYNYNTNPQLNDTDSDLMPDGWEINYGLNATKDDAGEDPDDDELTNYEEYLVDTDPFNVDSDGDGFSDFDEVVAGTDPNDIDDYPEIIPEYTISSLMLLVVGTISLAFLLKQKKLK